MDIVPAGYSNYYPDGYFVTSGLHRTTFGMVCVKILNPCHWNVPPEGQGFVRRALQTLARAASAGVSRPDELWFTLAGHAAVPQGDDITIRFSYSFCFTWVRHVHY